MKPKRKDVAWPPAGVHDLRPDVAVHAEADAVRFSTLRAALERAVVGTNKNPKR